ncbi:MAG: FHA domain-containing protein [Eubacterium sp.]
MKITDLIVGNVMGLPTDGIVTLSGLSGVTIIIVILSVLIPVLSFLSIGFYLIKRDEHTLEWYSMITASFVLVLSSSGALVRWLWVDAFGKIAKQISQDYTYLHITEAAFRNCFSFSIGFYTMLIVGILGVFMFLFVRFIWDYLSDYVLKRSAQDDLAYFESKNLSEDRGDNMRDNRKNPPFIRLENGGKTIRINKVPCVIGRNRNAVDYYLYDESLSRKHCLIDIQNGQTIIKDLNSLYGVQINNGRIEQEKNVVFHDKDNIKLGELSFTAEVNWEEIRCQLPKKVYEEEVVSTYPIRTESKRIVMSKGEKCHYVPTVTLSPGENNAELSACIINKTPYLIGRSKRNVDFSINSNSVSRKHCVIEYIDNDFYISDIGSSNGTRVNNVKLINNEKKKLSFDDRIKLGEVVFFFRK